MRLFYPSTQHPLHTKRRMNKKNIMLMTSTLSVALARVMATTVHRRRSIVMAFQTVTSSVYLNLSSSSRVISLRKSINSRTTMLSLFGDNDDDDYDTVSSSKLPYSTTTSNSASSSSPVAAAAAVLSLESRSSSPFRAPRSSFDDSLPLT